ncbi:MAG: outer membrane protein assembly factor BamA [Gammaproteobacteria bacterium]|nr:outer membrane protein assembly factor BamA [Gammaproteobacteria bacterium]MBU1656095.1 outer membrane protein assembly factor BamA [Gammaproteobacteria bacterium]MBU1962180.1 outer membrane protein assembly factor BamA [Gammaproteobacteria bacterium]
MRFSSRQSRLLTSLLLLVPLSVSAETFTVKDIRVEGLQRISAGTVFNYLPVQVGQTISSDETGDVVRALYKTGFFKDVRLEREGPVLVVFVQERPAIAKIDISGNKSIEDKKLLQALKDIGLAEGRVFNQSVLDRIERELNRQYFSLGKYGMTLKSTVTPLERNRVAIAIDIAEGQSARIKQINIVGNEAFKDGDLLSAMALSTGGWLTVLTKDNQYSRQKLAGDLESLKSYYLDRGYINFRIDSTQVTISPDKQDIYITINIHEGDVYTISDLKLAGNLVVDPEEFFPLIRISRGEVFSRKKAVESSEKITELMGDNGYAFANVNSIPDIDEANKTVALTFFVDPGKRVYVRRINMKGNARTRDEVLRREIRQMESAWFSGTKVKLSKERLQRLGYFEEVSLETKPVPGSTDQVDVDVSVKEKSSGSLMAGLGYSQEQGVMFSSSIKQDNFLGTGKKVGLGFNTSSVNTLYQLNYTNPYYTVDGISRGFNLKYQSTDFNEAGTADYSTDTMLAGMNFGIPINEFDRIGLSFDLEDTKLNSVTGRSGAVDDFIAANGSDTEYLNFKLSANWSHDSRDKSMLPTKGGYQQLYGMLSIPGSDLEYYKTGYRHQRYFPLAEKWIFAVDFDVAYGDGMGDTNDLPFYEHYFTGGPKSVRGYEANSLGPVDRISGRPIGGNLKTAGSLELFFPPPFDIPGQTVRLGTFVDVGNVFSDTNAFDTSELRASAGVSLVWLSPLGPFGISLASPLNSQAGDKEQIFQFTLGSAF